MLLTIACQQTTSARHAPPARSDEGAAEEPSTAAPASGVSLATLTDSTERAALDTPRILALHEANDAPALEAALASHRRVVAAAATRCEDDDGLEEGSAAQMACEKLLLARAYIPLPSDADFTLAWMEHLEGMAGVLLDLGRGDANPASSARARCVSARLQLFLASWETDRFLRDAAAYTGPTTPRLDAVDQRLDELDAKGSLGPMDQEELRALHEELVGPGDPDDTFPIPDSAPVTIDDLRLSVSLVRGAIERAAVVRSLGAIQVFDARWLTEPEVAWDAHHPFLEEAEARLDEDTIGRSEVDWTIEACE